MKISDAHRPWPAPSSPWLMRQVWNDVLFAHWAIDPEVLRPTLPAPLRRSLDTFDDKAWIGIVGFQVSGMRLRGLPTLPRIADFLELNVRTYLTVGGKPGVYFYSLDTPNLLAIAAARTVFDLPYFPSKMTFTADAKRAALTSRRWRGTADFRATYGPVRLAKPATADAQTAFLCERYCLYAATSAAVSRTEVLHPPWMVSEASASIGENSMTMPLGIGLPPEPPLVHFALRQETFIWPPQGVPEPELVSGSGRRIEANERVPL